MAATPGAYPGGVAFRRVPLRSYGVLKVKVLDRVLASGRSNHYQLLCGAGRGRWRAAINAHSDETPGEVEFAVLQPFSHPMLKRLVALSEGWHGLRPGDGLDYARGGIV